MSGDDTFEDDTKPQRAEKYRTLAGDKPRQEIMMEKTEESKM